MYKVLKWITKIAILNLLWILFTLVALILFGFFPATTALLMVIRNINLKKEKDIFSFFLHYYVENFLRANGYGYFLVAINTIFISITYMVTEQDVLYVAIPLSAISILVVVISLYVFPVYIYFETNFINHIKLSTIIALSHPVKSFVLFTLFAVDFLIIFHSNILIIFPFLFLFFMISGTAYLQMFMVMPILEKISIQKEIIE